MIDEGLEIQRQQAEIAKLEAETRAVRWQRWTAVAEIIKAGGAVAATILVVYAASATYRVTQLESRLALADKRDAEKERAASLSARDAATAAKISSERELTGLLQKVQTAQVQLARLGALKQSADVSASLKIVTGGLKEASLSAEQVLPYVLVVPVERTQNPAAAVLVDMLRKEGIRAGVNAPLRDVKNAPSMTEVDYFKVTDQDEALRVLRLLYTAGVAAGKVIPKTDRNVRRYRYYEVRLPQGFHLIRPVQPDNSFTALDTYPLP